jgi:hypothetical protein
VSEKIVLAKVSSAVQRDDEGEKKLQVQGNVACGMDEMKDTRQHFLLGKASLVGLSFVSSPIKDD